MRAIRLAAPLRLDGALDEAIYTSVPPISDFIQVEPDEGAPATEKTEVWVFFDDDNVYVSFRCFETEPTRASPTRCGATGTTSGRATTSSASRSTRSTTGATPFQFIVSPIGGRIDGQSHQRAAVQRRLESGLGGAAGRFEGGWTVEAAIPFKSLRYRPARRRIWGFNAAHQPLEERDCRS